MPRVERMTRNEIRNRLDRLRPIADRDLVLDCNAQGCAVEDGTTGRRLSPRTNPRMLGVWLDGFEEALRQNGRS